MEWNEGNDDRDLVPEHTVDKGVEKPASSLDVGGDTSGMVLYKAIHDIVPTNVRLARINLSDTDRRRLYGRLDTLLHRLTEYQEMFDIWEWTRTRIGMTLRTSPKHIPPEWTIRPSFDLWPPRRRRAILWVLAHMVYYSQRNGIQLSLADYADFLWRARWKTYQRARRQERVGNYLMLL